jgi:micrococcal nuclease
MGIHIPRTHFRTRGWSHRGSTFARSSQPLLLVFLIGLPILFCTFVLLDPHWVGPANVAAAKSRSWMLGGNNAISPQDSSAEMIEGQAFGGASSDGSGHVRFSLCHSGGGSNCVVDGDTFWSDGQKIRIADIDTPETHPARCAAEAELGSRATMRLQELLNAGPFTLTSVNRDSDKYGRKLRIVERGGSSVGEQLVSEGLARPYGGGYREGWCF